MISGGRIGIFGKVLIGVGTVAAAVSLERYFDSRKTRLDEPARNARDNFAKLKLPDEPSEEIGDDDAERIGDDVKPRKTDYREYDNVDEYSKPTCTFNAFRHWSLNKPDGEYERSVSKSGTYCLGKRCFPGYPLPRDLFPRNRDGFYTDHPYVFDAARYFLQYDGADRGLSWKEIQRRPFVFFKEGDARKRVTYRPTIEEFRWAQSKVFDSDPSRLNYMEFIHFAGRAGDDRFGKPFKVNVEGNEKKLCGDEYLTAHSRRRRGAIRRAVRRGIVSSLKDTWSSKRREIWKAVNDDQLSKVTGLMYHYLFAIEKMASSGNPELTRLCYLDCCQGAAFSIGAMASRASLRNKKIKVFWGDVGKIFSAVLDKAKSKKVKDIRSELTCLNEGKRYERDCEMLSLFMLLEKTNPDVVKRIKEWK